MTDTQAASSSPSSPPRSRRRYWILISLVVLVIALWSTYWAVARGMAVDILRNTYEVAETEGGALVCGKQRLGGYPFRFELECQPFEARDASGHAGSFSGLRVVALAYNPRQVIVEADGPATARFAGPSPFDRLSADWVSARGSARLSDAGVRNADLFIDQPKIAGVSGDAAISLSALRATVHARRNPSIAQDADFALRIAGLAIPALDGAAEISADVTFAGGAAALAGRGDWISLLRQDEAVRVSELRASASGVSLRATGTLALDAKGRLAGTLPLTVSGAENLPALLAPFFPQGSSVPKSLAGAVIGFGAPTTLDGVPAVTVPLRFEAGVARVGLIPIAALPPMY
ncbi:DUF2125 domain-containing protein [Stappia sp. ES.058]|uniref:DUF2125 domain-containing protein n=1 Tax=Stappia sp. ES.058 TaxID=1881061 RepID=UPI00087A341E|nr:DUF2125 domain-containing protein [Stappia sp. ES.058]SDU39741.1 hypothetical protein SAMN05428979_3469 [Stappia sp. ES.058]